MYDLELTYPTNGRYFSSLQGRCIIYAEASAQGGKQPFRIYNIKKKIGESVTVLAHHISYDLGGIPVSNLDASSSDEALSQIKANSVTDNPFEFQCKRTIEGSYNALVPKSARNRLLDKKQSLLATYGGEFKFDHFKVEYCDRIGSDTGYRIKYGVNLVDLSQESNFDKLYTGIYPYYGSGEENYFELPEKIVSAEGEFGFSRILPVSLTSEFSEAPGEDLLRAHAQDYISKQKIGVPEVSIELSHEHLSRFGDFCTAPAPEDVELGDTVWVEYQRFGITVTSRIMRVKYDSLRHKYISIVVGDVKKGLVETLLQAKNQKAKLEELSSSTNDATRGVGAALAAAAAAAAAAASGVSKSSLEDGSAKVSGITLPSEGVGGELKGAWNATPATAPGEVSPIVTIADLIALGLVTPESEEE